MYRKNQEKTIHCGDLIPFLYHFYQSVSVATNIAHPGKGLTRTNVFFLIAVGREVGDLYGKPQKGPTSPKGKTQEEGEQDKGVEITRSAAAERRPAVV